LAGSCNITKAIFLGERLTAAWWHLTIVVNLKVVPHQRALLNTGRTQEIESGYFYRFVSRGSRFGGTEHIEILFGGEEVIVANGDRRKACEINVGSAE
jgi:hypothetical protein